ncbi:MAG: hypothetical protein WDM86_22305 [Rhizomicrobium sp.]
MPIESKLDGRNIVVPIFKAVTVHRLDEEPGASVVVFNTKASESFAVHIQNEDLAGVALYLGQCAEQLLEMTLPEAESLHRRN